MKTLNICSVSGGKDSTSLYCLMQEYHGNDFLPIFADTGHEHPVTINYVRNLHVMTGGPKVQFVSGNFDTSIHRKKKKLEKETRDMIHSDGATYQRVLSMWRKAKRMIVSGNSFLDMCLWKGRAPSTKAQFCTEHLKLWPIKFWLEKHFPKDHYEWVMHTGMRAGESVRRSKMQPFSWNDFFECLSVLPMLYEESEDEFHYLETKGVPPNPLYALGYGRVGCFPCIHANKKELSLLPDWAWDRLNLYEDRLNLYEDRLNRSWFPSGILPGFPDKHIPKISEVREWCKTSRGGKQYDFFKSGETQDAPSCMTGWIACE